MGESRKAKVVKEGRLFRHSAGLLMQGGVWKDVWAVLDDDSTFRVYRDDQRTRKELETRLDGVVLFLAFGRAATKYGPPTISPTDQKKNVDPACLMAIPHSKISESITWFAAPTIHELEQWIRAMAKAVDGKARPPKLGKKPVAERIVAGLRETVKLDDKPLEWELYWLATCLAVNHEFNNINSSGSSISTAVALNNEEPADTIAWRNQLTTTAPGEMHTIMHESTNLDELPFMEQTTATTSEAPEMRASATITLEAVTAAE